MVVATSCKPNARLIFYISIATLSLAFQLSTPPKIAYGFFLSRIWQFMCGSIAYEFAEGQDLPTSKTEDNGELNPTQTDYDVKLWIPSTFTTLAIFIVFQMVLISPGFIADDVARIFATFLTGAVIYIGAKPYVLTNPFIVYCGDISYVLYLIHWPVIVAIRYYTDTQLLNTKGIRYAIEWNLREAQKAYFQLPCGPDTDTHLYTEYTDEHQLRCVAVGDVVDLYIVNKE
ncbi:hypothetical protein ANCCEY_03610 [Ancylostoma ceylanicum]|uniref:Acyltransferase 3 domain-containing protein n=1 Tax=Ancylostoma ceylanicum TaxID=53326 RepID=A0A0D6M1I5_9BILA|nr:hypothetical protein ANCCEY_03610 [Ancylostoma ceylanicum]